MADYPDNPGPLPSLALRNAPDGKGALGNEFSGKMFYNGSDRKELVLTTQKMLSALGYSIGSTGPDKDGLDGIFGQDTEKAVKDFQKQKKDWSGASLEVDGLVGPMTSDAMDRAMVGIWYDRYQTPVEITGGLPYHTVTAELMGEGFEFETVGVQNAKVSVVGKLPAMSGWWESDMDVEPAGAEIEEPDPDEPAPVSDDIEPESDKV